MQLLVKRDGRTAHRRTHRRPRAQAATEWDALHQTSLPKNDRLQHLEAQLLQPLALVNQVTVECNRATRVLTTHTEDIATTAQALGEHIHRVQQSADELSNLTKRRGKAQARAASQRH